MKEKAETLAPENFQKRGNQLNRGTLIPLQLLKVSHLRNGIKSLASPAVLGLLIETCEMINDKNHFYNLNAIF